MSIIVTPGETALIEAFNNAGITVIIENLLVGDIHIRVNGKTIYIFERKAKGDLDASIKDGRYQEQKGRLIKTGVPRKNIIYVIEQLSKSNNHKRIWSAICNTTHRDGFSVFKTATIDETVEYIVGISESCNKFTALDDSKVSDDVNVNIKKSNISIKDWFKYSLTLIPKCSLSIATVITDNYANMTALINAIEENGMECIANYKHGASQRRIGKKLSTDICNIILNNY